MVRWDNGISRSSSLPHPHPTVHKADPSVWKSAPWTQPCMLAVPLISNFRAPRTAPCSSCSSPDPLPRSTGDRCLVALPLQRWSNEGNRSQSFGQCRHKARQVDARRSTDRPLVTCLLDRGWWCGECSRLRLRPLGSRLRPAPVLHRAPRSACTTCGVRGPRPHPRSPRSACGVRCAVATATPRSACG
jgi:hypothetical protein